MTDCTINSLLVEATSKKIFKTYNLSSSEEKNNVKLFSSFSNFLNAYQDHFPAILIFMTPKQQKLFPK